MIPRTMMWLNMRRNHVGQGTISVPSPFDGDATVPYWYDKIGAMAHQLRHVGITDVLFPGSIRGSGGEFPNQDGYGPFDDYDIGSKGHPTRFGNAEKLRRAIAIFHANGINVHLDHVMHQRSGGNAGVYNYKTPSGTNVGRFAKFPGCFRVSDGRTVPPFVHEDPVPSPGDDFPFGDELCPINAIPQNYVWDGLIDGGDWLFRTTDADGARVDDMKGMAVEFMKAFFTSKAMQGKFFFGEFASGSRDSWWGGLGTNWWVAQVDGLASAIDFDFHYNMVQNMCMDSGHFYMGSLAGRGMIGNNPMKAIPFVESMDSDTNGFATIIFNKILGYALMLSGEGLPQIYVRDYLSDPDCYGLQPGIDNLLWIHQVLAHGSTIPRHGSQYVYVFERSGPPGLMVTLNNDIWNSNWYTVTVQTNWPPGTVVHDYTGHNSSDCTVDATGHITIGIPPGADGHGYGCWAPEGIYHSAPQPPARYTTQEFEGADDLDILPLTNTPLAVGRIWSEHDSSIELHMLTSDGLAPDFQCNLEILDPDGKSIINVDAVGLNKHSGAHGWYTLVATGVNFSASTRMPFRLRVTYQAPVGLGRDEF